jgi:hypothetical protein
LAFVVAISIHCWVNLLPTSFHLSHPFLSNLSCQVPARQRTRKKEAEGEEKKRMGNKAVK